MARRTLSLNVSSDDDDRLRLLAARTGAPIEALLAEAVALLFERHRAVLPEQLAWPVADAPRATDR